MALYAVLYAFCVWVALRVWTRNFDELTLSPLLYALVFGPVAAITWSILYAYERADPIVIWSRE